MSRMSAASVGLLATHPLWGKTAQSGDDKSVLVETAHFNKLGGWMLDNQFELHLGFSYLIAHGLGKPVKNASGQIKFPSAGTYHAWVLTKDWCPGDWEAPGQFQSSAGRPAPFQNIRNTSRMGLATGGHGPGKRRPTFHHGFSEGPHRF